MNPQRLTLFQRLGGAEVIEATTDAFQDRVLADPRLASEFSGADLRQQRDMYRAFLTIACDGPAGSVSATTMATDSRVVFLAPGDRQFRLVLGHLAAALAEVGLTGELVAAVAAAAESHRCSCIILADEKAPLRPVRQEACPSSPGRAGAPGAYPG